MSILTILIEVWQQLFPDSLTFYKHNPALPPICQPFGHMILPQKNGNKVKLLLNDFSKSKEVSFLSMIVRSE